MTPNTRTLKGQSYCSQRWANPAWPKGSKSRGFSTFGGFSSWGNNTAETKETIERLTTRNEALIDSLDRLNDTMKEANGAAESVTAAEQAKKYQEEVNENYRDIAAAQATKASTIPGASTSTTGLETSCGLRDLTAWKATRPQPCSA